MRELEVLVSKSNTLKEDIAYHDSVLSSKKEELKELTESKIPTFMIFNNIADFTGLSGESVKYKLDYHASTAQDRMSDILKFLGKFNSASGFKKSLSVEFPLEPNGDSPELVAKVKEALEKLGCEVKETCTIHYATLEATVRRLYPDMTNEDKALARDLLKVTEYFKTTIKQNTK